MAGYCDVTEGCPCPAFEPETFTRADLDAAVAAERRTGMQWLRHRDDCKAGAHCEDPFCHHNGECSCGLDTYLAGKK